MEAVPESSCPRPKSLFPGVTTSGALICPSRWENRLPFPARDRTPTRESPPGGNARSRPVRFRELEARRAKCGLEATVDGDPTFAQRRFALWAAGDAIGPALSFEPTRAK